MRALLRRSFILGSATALAVGRYALADDEADAQIEKKLTEIFAQHLGVRPETLKPSDRFFEEMGMDDLLEIGEILTDIERQFGIDIPVDIATMFTNMGNVIRFVKDLLASKRV